MVNRCFSDGEKPQAKTEAYIVEAETGENPQEVAEELQRKGVLPPGKVEAIVPFLFLAHIADHKSLDRTHDYLDRWLKTHPGRYIRFVRCSHFPSGGIAVKHENEDDQPELWCDPMAFDCYKSWSEEEGGLRKPWEMN